LIAKKIFREYDWLMDGGRHGDRWVMESSGDRVFIYAPVL